MEFNKFFQCEKLYAVCDYFPKSQREYSFYWLRSQFQNNITNNLTGAQPLGNIITSEAENQRINKAISIPNIQEIKKLDFFSAGSISLNNNKTA